MKWYEAYGIDSELNELSQGLRKEVENILAKWYELGYGFGHLWDLYWSSEAKEEREAIERIIKLAPAVIPEVDIIALCDIGDDD